MIAISIADCLVSTYCLNNISVRSCNTPLLFSTDDYFQVHYKRNMPDIDSLLDVWPEEFEQALKTLKLPSPDLDLSLAEYSKTLCGILDIPTYENPIESLHQMFSLYMDFRDNPHFQARDQSEREPGYGQADIMRVDQGY